MGFRSKPLAALSIVLVLASALGGWHAPDDRDEQGVPAVHHHSDHDARFSSATQPTAPEHCALCHWLRALGNGAPVATQTLAPESFQFVRFGVRVEDVRSAPRIALPPRAPPLA